MTSRTMSKPKEDTVYFSEDAEKEVRFHPSCVTCVRENPDGPGAVRCEGNYFRCPSHPWTRAAWATKKPPVKKKKKNVPDQKNKLI